MKSSTSRGLRRMSFVAGFAPFCLNLLGCGSSSNAPSAPAVCGTPTAFAWTSSDVLFGPVSDADHDLVAIKDPSVVFFEKKWHVYASAVDSQGNYNLVYVSFPDWNHVASATTYYMDNTLGFAGYHAAPQVFYFAPQNKWYLVYQSGPPQYSTNDDPGNPAAWTKPANFFAGEPPTVMANKGSGTWLDFWVICDDANCFLFFSDDNGHWYRSQTTLTDFPNGFGDATVVLEDSNIYRLYEASNVYKMKGTAKYLALIEGFDAVSHEHRYFRSWTADALDGDWTPLQDTFLAPFASTVNVTFGGSSWTMDISHGEMLRDGYDQTLEIDTCKLQYLYQGFDPTAPTANYNAIPWRLGLLSATN